MTSSPWPDYTRWNRAGLTSFIYVDGNAATYLDDLRAAMAAGFLRGAGGDARQAAYWREAFSRPFDAAEIEALRGTLPWPELLPETPPAPETASERNRRILAAYLRQSPDYAQEIMRAFARAAHVLLGHANAYANEGYLRTATQWETARKLAAMAGYQPAPPASATVAVALIAAAGSGVSEAAPGLAMSAPGPSGAPVIFETTEPLQIHPDLNAARVAGWNFNGHWPAAGTSVMWLTPDGILPKPGQLAVLRSAARPFTAAAAAIASASLSPTGTMAEIGIAGLQGPLPELQAGDMILFAGAELTLRGEAISSAAHPVLRCASVAALHAGDVVATSAKDRPFAVIESIHSLDVTLAQPAAFDGTATLTPLLPFRSAPDKTHIDTPPETNHLYFANNGMVVERKGSERFAPETKILLGYRIERQAGDSETGFSDLRMDKAKPIAARIVAKGGIPGHAGGADKTVGFAGKPPKSIAPGSMFVAEAGGTYRAMMVDKIAAGDTSFQILFATTPPGAPQETLFHGPMRQALRPLDWDRDPGSLSGRTRLVLTGVSPEAAALIRLGRVAIAEDERGAVAPRLLHVAEAAAGPGGNEVTVSFSDAENLAGLTGGWTVLRFNVVRASHGESHGTRILGSGQGDQKRQAFALPVKDITFIPGTNAESGVVPDIDVEVNGERWDYRDLTDLDAEDSRAYSIEPVEDGTLLLHFRRRLPTGTNNVLVTRHRIGAGPDGNTIAPYSFRKPERKHRSVAGIVQPLAPAGGAERESTAGMRNNAPARLAANGRAVSVEDFARLAGRHASVWQARADHVTRRSGGLQVRVTVVPANYGGRPLPATYYDSLTSFLQSRAAPGAPFTVREFDPVQVGISAVIRVDRRRFDQEKVKDASRAALLSAFGLRRRRLGQPLHRGEILAALETVEGLESATARFGVTAAAGRSKPSSAGGLTAYFARETELAYVSGGIDITVEDPS